MLRPLPQGLQRALFSLLQVPLGFRVTGGLYFCFPGDVGWASALPFFSGLLLLRLLAGVVGVLHPVSGCSSCGVVCLVCRWGSPATFFITLEWVCFWPKVSRVYGLRRLSRLPFVVRHPFPVSVGPSPFLELGWFLVTGWWPLLRLLVLDSSDARLHLHDALASGSTPISGRWMVPAPAFLGLCLGFFFLASRVGCWLGVITVYP